MKTVAVCSAPSVAGDWLPLLITYQKALTVSATGIKRTTSLAVARAVATGTPAIVRAHTRHTPFPERHTPAKQEGNICFLRLTH